MGNTRMKKKVRKGENKNQSQSKIPGFKGEGREKKRKKVERRGEAQKLILVRVNNF